MFYSQSAAIIISALAISVNGADVSTLGLLDEVSKSKLKLIEEEQVEIIATLKQNFVRQLDELIAKQKAELSTLQRKRPQLIQPEPEVTAEETAKEDVE